MPRAADHLADIDRLRAEGWPQHDPVRWRFIEALARRAAARDGLLRTRLDARLDDLLADYAATMKAAATGSPNEPVPAKATTPRPLAGLLAHIAAHAPPAAELQTLQRFRRTWTRLAADQRVTRSRTQLPQSAGPLNSQRLVHRALTLMHELSPEYLEHFVAQADALLWLERAGGGDLLAKKDVLVQAAGDRGKGKGRRRR